MAVVDEVLEMRGQGLTDNLIIAELSKKYSPDQVQAGIGQADSGDMGYPDMNASGMAPMPPSGNSYMGSNDMGGGPPPADMAPPGMQDMGSAGGDGNIYERIEEITENMIDEKWDELIGEVTKIVQWKEQVEEKQAKMLGDIEKLKEDFSVLHKGVLGKLETYDTRMRDVGTELHAVGKVFKDVIPEFVENVKELKHIKDGMKEA